MKVKMLAAMAVLGLVCSPLVFADDNTNTMSNPSVSGTNNPSAMSGTTATPGGPGAMSGTSNDNSNMSNDMSGSNSNTQSSDSSSNNGTSADTATGDDDY